MQPAEKKNCGPSWNDLLYLHGFHHRATFIKMMALAWGVEVKAFAEVGVYRGVNAQILQALFQEALMYLIDPWQIYSDYLSVEAMPMTRQNEEMEKAYAEVVGKFALNPKVEIIRKTSLEASKRFSKELDLVFIDGNHEYAYVKEDIQIWSSKVRAGGILAGHDYDPQLFPDVVRAVNEAFPKDLVVGDDATWLVLNK